MLKNISIALLISLVSLISGGIGYTAGYLSKGESVELANTTIAKNITEAMERVVDASDEQKMWNEPFSSFWLHTLILEASESEQGEPLEIIREITADALQKSKADVERFCASRYSEVMVLSCEKTLADANNYIQKYRSHNNAIKERP